MNFVVLKKKKVQVILKNRPYLPILADVLEPQMHKVHGVHTTWIRTV
jgi:hypothetical protein